MERQNTATQQLYIDALIVHYLQLGYSQTAAEIMARREYLRMTKQL